MRFGDIVQGRFDSEQTEQGRVEIVSQCGRYARVKWNGKNFYCKVTDLVLVKRTTKEKKSTEGKP